MNFIAWLEQYSIPYFIAWGYENLPDQHSGGDVDMYIHPEHYAMVAEELARRNYSSAKCPAYGSDHKHEQFAQSGCYSLHLFSNFCFDFMGKTLVLTIDPQQILQDRTKWKEFWVSSPMVEMLFTALRILGGRKDANCMERIKKHSF